PEDLGSVRAEHGRLRPPARPGGHQAPQRRVPLGSLTNPAGAQRPLPSNGALKANTPPSAATSQYPAPLGSAAIPTHGAISRKLPADHRKGAPKLKIPPSAASSQYP